MLWALDDVRARTGCWRWSTRTSSGPSRTSIDEDGTYVDDRRVLHPQRVLLWNHGLGEIVTALLAAGMRLTMLVEHDSVPWQALPGQMDGRRSRRVAAARRAPERLPHTYTLQAVKN